MTIGKENIEVLVLLYVQLHPYNKDLQHHKELPNGNADKYAKRKREM